MWAVRATDPSAARRLPSASIDRRSVTPAEKDDRDRSLCALTPRVGPGGLLVGSAAVRPSRTREPNHVGTIFHATIIWHHREHQNPTRLMEWTAPASEREDMYINVRSDYCCQARLPTVSGTMGHSTAAMRGWLSV